VGRIFFPGQTVNLKPELKSFGFFISSSMAGLMIRPSIDTDRVAVHDFRGGRHRSKLQDTVSLPLAPAKVFD